MKELILKSFRDSTSKKLSAFAIMLCVALIHLTWLRKVYNENQFAIAYIPEILIIDLGFIATCLGITAFEKTKLSNGNKDTTQAGA